MLHPDRTRWIEVPNELVPAVERLIQDAAARPGAAPACPLVAPAGPIDYRTAVVPAPRPLTDWALTVVLVLFAATLTVLSYAVVPRFEEVFRDFGTKLPAATVVLLRFARWFNSGVGLALVWLLALGLPVAVARVRRWPPRPGYWMRAFLTTFLLVVATCLLVYILLYLPMITLIQSVGGGKR